MTMTKKDFENVAQAFSVARPSDVPRRGDPFQTYGRDPGSVARGAHWAFMVDVMSSRFENAYPLFNPERFKDACYA